METLKIGSVVVVRGAPFGFTKRPAYAYRLGDVSTVVNISRMPVNDAAGVLCYCLTDHYFYAEDVLEVATERESKKIVPVAAPTPAVCSVTRPAHYNQGKIECLDAMVEAFGEDAVRAYAKINAFKYLWRSEYKNGMEDLKKAIFYLTYASGTDPRKES